VRYATVPTEDTILVTSSRRLAPWQTALKPGDYFLVVVQEGVILYGKVLLSKALPPQFRRVKIHSEASPKGDEDVVDLHMADLPMTDRQFGLARMFGWPSDLEVMRTFMSMVRPARA